RGVEEIEMFRAAWVLLAAQLLTATEKHWIAHEAQLIVESTYKPRPTFPWFDGWHISGAITVDAVLYGKLEPRQIKFRFLCPWEGRCTWWPPPAFVPQKALWFLRHIDGDFWESAIGFPDPGFRDYAERAYWENYIRLYKQ